VIHRVNQCFTMRRLRRSPSLGGQLQTARQMALGGLVCALSSAGGGREPLRQWRNPEGVFVLARGKSKGAPAYGALGGRQVGTCTCWPWGFWCVADSGETEGVAGLRSCAE
jgi:hypothetical protein